MTKYLAPWKEDLNTRPSNLLPPHGRSSETCFDAFPNRRSEWESMATIWTSRPSISVEWDGNAISEAKAQSWADALNPLSLLKGRAGKTRSHRQYLTLDVADSKSLGAVT